MASSLSVAIEEHEGSAKEIEYGFFVRVNDELLGQIIESLNDCEKKSFSESKLPTERGYYSRLRCYFGESSDTNEYILTTKVKDTDNTGGPTANHEDNAQLTPNLYKAMMQLTTQTVVRTRYTIPFIREGEPIIRSNGEPLAWEVDVYVDGRSGGARACNWIKLDLEVDRAANVDVIQYIPFDYEELIEGNSKVPEERALIDKLYSTVYPVVNKTE